MICVLTWNGWSWGGLCADLAWMEVGWSVYRPGMDGVGVVFVLTWHEWKWGGLSADLKGMDLGCLCTDLALMDMG